MSLSKKTKKAGMLLLTAIVIISLFAGMMKFGLFTKTVTLVEEVEPEPTFPADHLEVDATYLLKTDETNDSVNITSNIYLTNSWEKESGNIKAIAYVIEEGDQFAVFKNTVEIGSIVANSTTELEVPVVLGNNSYRIEVLIFEDEKLIIKGELGISAYPVYHWEDNNQGNSDGRVKSLSCWNVSNTDMDYVKVRK